MARKGHGRKPAGVELSGIYASIISWLFCMKKLKAKTLWAIVLASGLCAALSFVIATPIGMLADKILLARFAEQRSLTHSVNPWQYMDLGEQIFTFTTLFIAFVALVCGSWAAWTLWKRRRHMTSTNT